jgi:hypothetical protein
MTTKHPVWLWARPLRQPVVGRRDFILACVSPGILDLPGSCCRCTKPTEKSRPVTVVETSGGGAVLAGAEFLTGHLGHIVAGVRLLAAQKIAVPTCPACWSLHRRGVFVGLAIILTGFATFVAFSMLDETTKLRMPVWVTFAAVVGTFIVVIIGGTVSALLTARATSLLIYRTRENQLYYEFWSPQCQEYLKSGAAPANRPSTPEPVTVCI